MARADDFSAAPARVKQLTRTPSSDELLDLYACYKQANTGDAQGERPGLLDFKGRAKFDAWAGRKGWPQDRAMTAYIELVAKLVAKYGIAAP